MAAETVFHHLRVRHGLHFDLIALPDNLHGRSPLRSYAQEIEVLEARARLLRPPLRWFYLWRIKHLRGWVDKQRDESLAAMLDEREQE